ncbi:T-cell ecto-ADP-ribosyltransferase 2-like [Stegastes partitus]|uniref:NAD(P)(+)--arginine ADP-ribosyltransferase n=1 Tax=Stegastes partitus TaxID=144197 RepID=A0A3B5AAA8_9TELE|nr:PREDICTED: T-cell ecto-ADP-ribosyltransferase 2-like [Stegastes partitus]
MTFSEKTSCEWKSLRSWAALCALLGVVLLLYADPFLILWWPQRPSEQTVALPLDMATESIDDMYDGCQSKTASVIDLYGVFEWHFNRNFSFAWAFAERHAKKPAHKDLKEDHATVLYLYTKVKFIRDEFNKAVKRGKQKYSTDKFKFHYFYFYLTNAIQVLRQSQTQCRTTYHRTWKKFKQNVVNTDMRFGVFMWTTSSKSSAGFGRNVSCFEINTCLGADITYYSGVSQRGQVLIPTYEVFKVTDVVTNDPWCGVVYKLQSTKAPRTVLNCKVNEKLIDSYFETDSTHWQGSRVVMMSACVILLISAFVLVKQQQKCFVAAVLGALLVLIVVVLMVC